MRQMKNSKIEWVGEIPEHWATHPIYYFFGERKHKNTLGEEKNLLSLSYGKVVRKDIATTEGLLPENYNGYNIVEKDDIALRLTDLQNDKRSLRTGLVKEKGILTSAYVTLRPIRENFSPYFHYLLHAYDVVKVFYNMGNGVRQGLNFDELSKCMLIAPPLSEQKAIAGFLDKKCGEVDALIADIQQEIETLEQYKRSVITESVTKGLDSSAPMKDSGIEWVGEIPAHWGCKPIRALFLENNNKNCFRKETRALQFKNGEIVPKHNFNADDDEYVAETILKYNIVDKGMIVINGLNLNFDFVTKRVGLVHDRGIITSAYMSFSVKDLQAVMPKYACYLLKSYDNCAAFHNMGGGVRKILNFDELKHNLFILPSLSEQKAIADYLDDKCKEIEGIITDKQSQIETLEAYKKSLIYEYVTGKKEVVA